MEAFPVMLGLWLALPVPLETEVTHGKTAYTVAAVVLRPHNAVLPVEAIVPYKNRDGWRSLGWLFQPPFDDYGVDRLYILSSEQEPLFLAGWQLQLLRLRSTVP